MRFCHQRLQQAADKSHTDEPSDEISHTAVRQFPLNQDAQHIGIEDDGVDQQSRRKDIFDNEGQEAPVFPLCLSFGHKRTAEHWRDEQPDQQLRIDVPFFGQGPGQEQEIHRGDDGEHRQ